MLLLNMEYKIQYTLYINVRVQYNREWKMKCACNSQISSAQLIHIKRNMFIYLHYIFSRFLFSPHNHTHIHTCTLLTSSLDLLRLIFTNTFPFDLYLAVFCLLVRYFVRLKNWATSTPYHRRTAVLRLAHAQSPVHATMSDAFNSNVYAFGENGSNERHHIFTSPGEDSHFDSHFVNDTLKVLPLRTRSHPYVDAHDVNKKYERKRRRKKNTKK